MPSSILVKSMEEPPILTNGSVWLLFRSFKKGTNLKDRIVWEVNLEKDSLTASIRKLKTLSKENVDKINALLKQQEMFDNLWQELLDDRQAIINGFTDIFYDRFVQTHPDYQIEKIEAEDFVKERFNEFFYPNQIEEEIFIPPREKTSDKKVMKLGNDVFLYRYAKDILLNTANWLIDKGKLKKSDYPIFLSTRSKSKRYLINYKPLHGSGKKFHSPKQIKNGLWIETNASLSQIELHARRLLEKFGYSSDILVIGEG